MEFYFVYKDCQKLQYKSSTSACNGYYGQIHAHKYAVYARRHENF